MWSGKEEKSGMDMNRLVTVITPCYNSEKTIRRTIESVLNQTYENIEYLIIDGASKDKTVEIAKSYEEAFGGRMKIFSEPDEGIYYAMNKGIGLATGELIGIVNSDDYYEQEAVEHIVGESSDKPYQILYGFERILNEGQETQIVIHHHTNLPNQMITHPTCFVTKKLYEDKGVFNTNYRYSADYEFMLRMFQDKQVEFKPVYQLISNYALGGASGTGDAYLETMGLHCKYGVISKKKYNMLKMKLKLSKMLGRFLR